MKKVTEGWQCTLILGALVAPAVIIGFSVSWRHGQMIAAGAIWSVVVASWFGKKSRKEEAKPIPDDISIEEMEEIVAKIRKRLSVGVGVSTPLAKDVKDD